jgi:WD40 repeat protein/serine/threonine protein kinase
MICSFFLPVWRTSGAPNGKKKRDFVERLFTQGGGLGGLALGYYLAAPAGRRKGEPACWTQVNHEDSSLWGNDQMSTNQSSEETILEQALTFATAEERNAYLQGACRGNAALRARVESLIQAHQAAGGFLREKRMETDPTVQLPTSSEAEVGSVIGHYKLLQKIGEGGCGLVYMAEQHEPVRRRVALKIIKLGMDTKQVIARFEAERQALALMEHPNIARVFDAGATSTGRPYFVMELVRGVKITDYCDQKNLSTSERLKLFIQVCQAIQHAHQKGIIHRDIKPSNILVTVNDGVAVPKVIDFGIAKATAGQQLTNQTIFTAFEQFIGTPAYMSPEQAELTSVDIDTRSDIYSLGVLLYELLTGKTPFDPNELMAAGLDEMRRTIRDKEPPRPSTRLGTLPGEELSTTAQRRSLDAPKLISLLRGDLDWIAMKCLEKDRSRRYETANGLAMDIQRHLNQEPVVARPPSAGYRFQKLVRRNKLAFAAAAGIAGALLAGSIVSTTQAIRARRAELAAKAEKEHVLRAEGVAVRESELANEQRARADASAQAARQSLYEADMILAIQAIDQSNLGLARELLDKHRPGGHEPDLRGWEWRYAWGRGQSDELGVMVTKSGLKMRLALSHDGRLLSAAESIQATAAVYLWELPSGPLLAVPETNDANGSVSFSPDGKLLAFSTRNHGIKLWDVEARRELTNFPGVFGNGWFSVLQFSPDGRCLAASRDKPEVVVWDIPSKTVSHRLTDGLSDFVSSLAFSPDSTTLATGGFDNAVRIWSLAEEKPITPPLRGHRAAPFSLAFSPDGKILASASWDHTIRIWDTVAQRLIKELTNHYHTGIVTSVTFSPDQKYLASSSNDSSIRLWDTARWEEAGILRGSPNEIWSIAYLPDGQTLVSGGKDGAIRTWSAVPKVREPEVLERTPGAVAWGVTGSILYGALTNGTITFWDASTLRQRAQYRWPEEDRTNSIARDFSASGKLAWVNSQGEVVVWDLNSARQLARMAWGQSGAKFLKISPDEKLLVGGSGEARCLRVWDLQSGRPIATLPKSEESDPAVRGSNVNQVDVVSFSTDSRLFAYGNWNGTVEVWDLYGKERVANWPVHHEPVTGLAFMPDGKRIVSASYDATAKLWDIATGADVKSFARALYSFEALAVAPDGQRVAASTSDGVIKIWNATTRQEVATLKLDLDSMEAEDVFALQFLPPDGNTLLVMTPSKARIWHAPSWAEIQAAEAKHK